MNVTVKTQRIMKKKSTVSDIRGIVSNPPGFLALKPLRLCVFAVYELFRLERAEATRQNTCVPCIKAYQHSNEFKNKMN